MKNTHRYFYLILFFVSIFQINGKAETLTTEDYSKMTKDELDAAFVWAVERNEPQEAEKLIQAGADVNTSIHCWETMGTGEGCWDYDYYLPAFKYAAIKNRPGLIRIFLKYQKHLNNTPNEALLVAAGDGSLDAAKELIKNGADVNYISVERDTPLILAAKKGHLGVVKELMGAGANVNYIGKNKTTALTVATKNGSFGVVQELIQRGADVNHADENKNTPLILAIDKGCSDKLIKTLLDAGADVTCANKKGRTALMEAVKNHDLNIVQELLKIPAMHTGSFFGFGTKPINYADEDGNTALIHAVKNIRYSYIAGRSREYRLCVDSQSIVEKLFNTPGIDHHHINKSGETAITLFEKLKKSCQMF